MVKEQASILLYDQDREELEFLKTHHNLRTKAEAVRFAIHEQYKIAKAEKGSKKSAKNR